MGKGTLTLVAYFVLLGGLAGTLHTIAPPRPAHPPAGEPVAAVAVNAAYEDHGPFDDLTDADVVCDKFRRDGYAAEVIHGPDGYYVRVDGED